ncbi:hypothetical protein JCM8547_000364 [Rhodosporidiobolus lusitaniae]
MLASTSARLLTGASARPACRACQQSQRRHAHKLVEVELTTDVPSLGRRGDRLPVAPGIARNRLIPGGQALYVVAGQAHSPLQRMFRKEAERAGGLASIMAKQREQEAEARAKRVLDELTGAADPHAAARKAELSLLDNLSGLPQPLTFSRLTTSPTSSDLFGSVSAVDVISLLREKDIHLDASQAAFVEQKGVEKGRVKVLGEFTFAVQMKVLEREYPVQVKVEKA